MSSWNHIISESHFNFRSPPTLARLQLTLPQCQAACDADANCKAFDRPDDINEESAAECCLFLEDNFGDGVPGRTCYFETVNHYLTTWIDEFALPTIKKTISKFLLSTSVSSYVADSPSMMARLAGPTGGDQWKYQTPQPIPQLGARIEQLLHRKDTTGLLIAGAAQTESGPWTPIAGAPTAVRRTIVGTTNSGIHKSRHRTSSATLLQSNCTSRPMTPSIGPVTENVSAPRTDSEEQNCSL